MTTVSDTHHSLSTSEVIVADDDRPRLDAQPDGTRRLIEVAVGILCDGERRYLLTSRPQGKSYAGHWEFPGGKLEQGETVEQALARELHEELGIVVDPNDVRRWRSQVVDYPHALVRLHFCRLDRWRGDLQMREGQQASWQSLPVRVAPVLAGTVPVLEWLQAEGG